MKGRKWILAKHFQGSPKEGDLKLVEFELPEIKEGGKPINLMNFTMSNSLELGHIFSKILH